MMNSMLAAARREHGAFETAVAVSLTVVCFGARAGVTISQWTDYAYGVTIQSPWSGGGYIDFNYPEHFEHKPGGWGILRWSDAGGNKWVILDAGARATLDVMSPDPGASGVRCESELVVNGNTVETWWRVTNNSGSTLDYVHGLFCLHYITLTDFPDWWTPRFPNTYLLIDGALTTFDQLTCPTPGAEVKTAFVWNSPYKQNSFAEGFGGVAEEEADCGFIAVRSTTADRYVSMMWEYGREVFSNSGIPCAHADPLFGDLPDGQSVIRYGRIVFHEGTLGDILPTRPTAVIEIGNPGEHLAGEPVQFIGSNSTDDGTIESYDWDFGDGQTFTQADTTHSYAADGVYTVTLTVVDNYSLEGEATYAITIGTGGGGGGGGGCGGGAALAALALLALRRRRFNPGDASRYCSRE